jgi:hypothetical protein
MGAAGFELFSTSVSLLVLVVGVWGSFSTACSFVPCNRMHCRWNHRPSQIMIHLHGCPGRTVRADQRMPSSTFACTRNTHAFMSPPLVMRSTRRPPTCMYIDAKSSNIASSQSNLPGHCTVDTATLASHLLDVDFAFAPRPCLLSRVRVICRTSV